MLRARPGSCVRPRHGTQGKRGATKARAANDACHHDVCRTVMATPLQACHPAVPRALPPLTVSHFPSDAAFIKGFRVLMNPWSRDRPPGPAVPLQCQDHEASRFEMRWERATLCSQRPTPFRPAVGPAGAPPPPLSPQVQESVQKRRRSHLTQ